MCTEAIFSMAFLETDSMQLKKFNVEIKIPVCLSVSVCLSVCVNYHKSQALLTWYKNWSS